MERSYLFSREPDYGRGGGGFKRWATVVNVFLAINISVFILQRFLNLTEAGADFETIFGLNFNLIKTPYFLLIALQLVTYQFLHGGVLHILINMLLLWFFGRELEDRLGARRFLFLYLVSGVVGGLVQVAVGLLQGVENFPGVVGASGAVYGILVYYAMMWPNRTVNMFLFPIIVPLKVKHLVMILVGIALLYGILPGEGDGVAHMCHLGGAIFGFCYFRYGEKGVGVLQNIKVHQEKKKEKKVLDEEKEIDRLLNKIHTDGINALTDQERKFLNKASRRYRSPR